MGVYVIYSITMTRTVGALPSIVRIIGCQPSDADAFGMVMHSDAEAVVPRRLIWLLS